MADRQKPGHKGPPGGLTTSFSSMSEKQVVRPEVSQTAVTASFCKYYASRTGHSANYKHIDMEDDRDAAHRRRVDAQRAADAWKHKLSKPTTLHLAELVFPDGEPAVLTAEAVVPRYIQLEVVLDSGAGAHVVGKHHIPGYAITESALSRAGAAFRGADGGRIRNHGESLLQMMTMDGKGAGHAVTSHFQVADVTRPLWSVGLITDSGLEVKFWDDHASIFDKNGHEICHFARTGGLYVTTVQLENPAHPDFQRQGA